MEATIEQLQAEIADLKQQLSAKAEELEKTLELNESLNAIIESEKELAAASTASKVSAKKFERDNVVYGFKRPAVFHKNKLITAEDVLASESLQDELIRIKSGLIYQA